MYLILRPEKTAKHRFLIAVKTTIGNTNPIKALPNIQFIFVF
jgi:hypothetical protein